MGSDRARISYDPAQQYRAVVAQQGRVTLEADWNEAQQIASEELREEILDVVGPSGTPDNGYEVFGSDFHFSTSPGTIYVGGMRVFSGDAVDYEKQKDWLDFEGDPDWVDPEQLAKTPPTHELIYLLLREQEVSAVEDSALLEKALGGADTTNRLRLIQRIVRLSTTNTTCDSAWQIIEKLWFERGLFFDPSTQQLRSNTRLKVSFAPQQTPVDLCEPEARSGYLGVDNQLIRVQVIDSEKLVWGFDNASFLYQAEIVSSDQNSTTLRLIKPRPVDDYHLPRINTVVEVLRSAAQLSNQEYIASPMGFVTTLTVGYNPDTREVSFAGELPQEYQETTLTPRLFLRVWEGVLPFTRGFPVTLGETGLQVTLSAVESPIHIGDYWQIAVRPSEQPEVYPKRYLESFQPPDGPRLWACPLAVIRWASEPRPRELKIIEDCRNPFDNLIDLTRRNLGGCCTITLRPEDLSQSRTLQSILDRFASQNRPNRDQVTICLMPGIYRLTETLQLGPEHSNFTIQGCGDGAELQAEPGSEVNFLHGLIVLNHANYVTLSNLRFQLPIVPFVRAGGKLTPLLSGDTEQFDFGSRFQETLRVSIGIRPLHCALLTVQNCLFRFEIQKNINLFATGIFAGSECWGLRLIDNRFLQDEEYLLIQEQTRENERRFLTGYLLSPSLIPTQERNAFEIVSSLLQDAVIRDNRFAGLTTAVLILADTGVIRVETNTVLQSISGFWFTPLELGEVLGINLETAFLGFLFPLPDSFDVRQFAQKFEGNVLNIPGIDRLSLSFYASGNDIDTRASNESQVLSGPSLVVAGNQRQNSDDRRRDSRTTSNVILTANKFCNHLEPSEKTTFFGTVLITNVERCTVTGNLILNEYIQAVYSLVFPIREREEAVVSVTGNIFKGRPQLPDRRELGTSVPAPMNTWEFLNTIIP
jgi:hypothetical protein